MKTFLGIVIALYCIFPSNAQGQPVLVKSSLNSSVETKGNVTLDGSLIELTNVVVTCNSLLIKNTVTEIKTSGTVKINCKDFVLESGGHDISLENSTGLFAIEYLDKCVENGKSFVIINNSDFKLKFSKKSVIRN